MHLYDAETGEYESSFIAPFSGEDRSAMAVSYKRNEVFVAKDRAPLVRAPTTVRAYILKEPSM